ncbi:carbohydrate ABC transporter permease [Hathewaya limosa]|uniref:Multiple sugar transport system permease protein n=1 Tax=Hathewaya limosa TaxID=1536 RepID=A0ABU0JSY9_HATLI|nr:sugar ABC transporter permease [Hathewaya limosa]MDQ0480208.1 multiple sugar transport system permease protein [Hathewaya limosa]
MKRIEKKHELKKSFKLKKLGPYGYILPLGIILFSFYVIPIIMSIYFSFTKYNIMIPEKFIGFQNYKRLFNDNTFKISVLNTIKFTLIVVPIQTTLAIILAVWVKSRSKSFIGKFAKAVMFIPVMSSMIVIGVIWKALLSGDTSPVNQFLGIFHIGPVNWLGDVNLSLYTLMGINIWKNVGYFMVIYIAALMDIPKSYYEAARVDGATKWQEFKNITLPLLKPTTVMVVFLGSIWSLQIFDLVYSLTGGGPGMSTMTMVMYAYNLNFKNFNSGYAMAVANILFFIIAIATILQRKFIKKENSTY